MRKFLLGVVVVVMLTTFGAVATAQSLWLDRTSSRAVALEFVKPSFNSSADVSFTTAVWFLSTRIAANDVFSVVFEAPYSNFSVDGASEGSSTIGNIYVGVELDSPEAGMFLELGGRLPVVDDNEIDALLSGAFTEFVDREEAFAPEAFPLMAAVNHYKHHDTGLVTRVRGGAAFWVPKGDREDVETFFLYGGQIGYASDVLSILVGITGRWYLTAPSGGAGENTVHQMGMTVGPRLGRVNPALHFRVPMDEDLSDIIDFVWGLSVNVDVNS